MKSFLLVAFALFVNIPMGAMAAVEPDYAPGPLVTNAWFANQGAEEQKADLWFIKGMRPHHAGALSMSKEYLSSKNASNAKLKALAGGIITNQTFEIGMMNRVEELVGKPLQAALGQKEWRQVAEQGLAQKQKFVRAPMPTSFGIGNTPVTKRDVEFAKAMVVHHEGALTMCKQYLDMPSAENKYLRLLCVDVLKDQAQEIAFMNKIITFYDGNLDDVKIDPSMIHGMEGMSHDMGGDKAMHHPTAAKKSLEHKMQMEHMEHMQHMDGKDHIGM